MNLTLLQHQIALLDAWRRLLAAPLNSLLSLLVIAIALTLPAAGYVLLDNAKALSRNLASGQQISVFMAMDASRNDVNAIQKQLQADSAWPSRFISREDALRQLQEAPGMAEALGNLNRNPLPDAFVVDVSHGTAEQQEALVKEYRTWPKVAHVQQDAHWAKRLDALLDLGRMAVGLISLVFAVGLMAVTFHSIRLQIMGQAAEVELSRLIGATNAFISRPFLYFGTLQGLLGGLLAALLATLGLWLLAGPADQLLAHYGEGLSLHGPGLGDTLLLTLLGGSLGWLGARLSLALFLAHRS